jgi:hypothetical protein
MRLIEAAAGHRKATLERMRGIHLLSLIGLREHTDEWYGRIFAQAPEDAICGEITPEYALLPPAGIEHMLRLSPTARFIFVLRDPIERGWSDLRMLRARPQAKAHSDLDRIRTRDFLARADYTATIEAYRQRAAPGHFLTLYFDDIAERPDVLFREVCEFLGLSADDADLVGLDEPVHQGEPSPLPPEIHEAMKSALKPAYERLRALDNPIVEGWYRRHYG